MAITRAQQVRQMLREGSEPMEQAGVMNYRPSEMVTVPRIAKSSPNTPTAKLAYITPEEQDILVKLNLYGSLEGKPNRGPGGIPSLEGDFGSPTGDTYSEAGSDDYSGFTDTGTGDYVAVNPNVSIQDQRTARANAMKDFYDKDFSQPTKPNFINRVTDRIKGFGTGAKNYLSDPSNRRGLLTNVALTSLLGPVGLILSGLARTSKFQNMLSNLKGDDLLQGTNTIEFDKPVNKDLLKFIDKNKQITDVPYPDIDARQANFQSTPFYQDNVMTAGLTKKQEQMLKGPQKLLRDYQGATDEDILENIKNFSDDKDPATIEDIQRFYKDI